MAPTSSAAFIPDVFPTYPYSYLLAFSVSSITNILSTAPAAVQSKSSTSTSASIFFLPEPAVVVIISKVDCRFSSRLPLAPVFA